MMDIGGELELLPKNTFVVERFSIFFYFHELLQVKRKMIIRIIWRFDEDSDNGNRNK